MDEDLKKQLTEINQNLVGLKARPGIWRSFFNGMFSAFGYVAGLVLVIVILGWFLNKTGLLPSFKEQLKNFQSMMNQAQQLIHAGQSQQGSGQTGQ